MSHHKDAISSLTPNSATTTESLANAAHDLINETAAKAEPVEKQLRDHAETASAKLNRKQQAASEQIDHSIKRVESFAKERPLAAAGIAFAAGILATTLLRR